MDLKSMTTEELLILLKRTEINRDSLNRNIDLISQELQGRPMNEVMGVQFSVPEGMIEIKSEDWDTVLLPEQRKQ